MCSNVYKKWFILDIFQEKLPDETLPSANCFRMCVVGVVIAIQLYQERIIYTVDDGTGILECSLRLSNCPERLQVSQITQELTRNGSCDISIKADVHHILNKLENYQKMSNELHHLGDLIMVFGYVFTSNGRSCLKITIHSILFNFRVFYVMFYPALVSYSVYKSSDEYTQTVFNIKDLFVRAGALCRVH